MSDEGRSKGGRKRKAEDEIMDDDTGVSPSGKARGKQIEKENEMNYEDPFEDEYDDEDGEEDAMMADGDGDDDDENAMDVTPALEDDDDEDAGPAQAFIPGMGEDVPMGELEYDSSAYDMIHFMKVEWPCLSFDVIADALGSNRQRFPHTAYVVAGTQADVGAQNRLYLLKMSQLHKTRNDDLDSDDEDADDDDGADDEDAALTFRQIKHPGGTNRVRSLPSQAHVVATWSDNGKVYLWNTLQHIHALDVPPASKLKSVDPIETLSGHRTEGFALSWNANVEGRLGTADCNGDIHVWLPAEAGWKCETQTPLRAHQGSVEDLHWNPAETDVFATCSVDGTIKLWDLRQRAVGLTIKAHSADVNVMSWNRSANHLIVSGGDDGVFNVWDLRLVSQGQTAPARAFNWHKGPITSVEWNPNDESSIIVSSEDNTVTLWDIALTNEDTGDALDEKLPPELLFIHQGQDQIKEVHWHPQIPDVLISTAVDGFNIFKPNITPQEGE